MIENVVIGKQQQWWPSSLVAHDSFKKRRDDGHIIGTGYRIKVGKQKWDTFLSLDFQEKATVKVVLYVTLISICY